MAGIFPNRGQNREKNMSETYHMVSPVCSSEGSETKLVLRQQLIYLFRSLRLLLTSAVTVKTKSSSIHNDSVL